MFLWLFYHWEVLGSASIVIDDLAVIVLSKPSLGFCYCIPRPSKKNSFKCAQQWRAGDLCFASRKRLTPAVGRRHVWRTLVDPQTASFLLDLGVNVGLAFVGVVFALWYENRGAPRLIVSPGATTDDVKPNGWRTRYLHLTVTNSPRRAPLVSRQTAVNSHGTILFLDESGKRIGNVMPIRWDGAPEAIKPEVVGGKIVYLPDARLLRVSRFIDIPPDETESLAVAVRIQGDNEAFGWTSESYFHQWRHPDFRLPYGRYIAQVALTAGDAIVRTDVPFNNPPEFECFDLAPPGR